MNIKNIRFLTLIMVAACLTGTASASTVFFLPNGGGSETVFGLTGFTTDGQAMGNLGTLSVTVNFVGGGSSSATWVAGCGTGCGSASGTIGNGTWTLTETGNTGSVANVAAPDTTALNGWTLTNTSTTTAILSVVLNGGAQIAFDRDLGTGGSVGTPGSAFGIDYSIVGNSFNGSAGPFSVNVSYDNQVSLFTPQACQGTGFVGNTPCGDLWGKLTFVFTGSSTFIGAVGSAASWTFFQDTDTVGTPEPLSAGFGGLGACCARLVSSARQVGATLDRNPASD